MDKLLFHLLAGVASFTTISSNTLYYGDGHELKFLEDAFHGNMTKDFPLPDECYEPFSCSGRVDGFYQSPWNCAVYIHCNGGEISQGKRYEALTKSSTGRGEARSCTTICTNQPPTSPTTTVPIPSTPSSDPCDPFYCDSSFFAIIQDPWDCYNCYGCFYGVEFGYGPCPGVKKMGEKLAIERNATVTVNYVMEKEGCVNQCTNPPNTTIAPTTTTAPETTTTEGPTTAPSTTEPVTVETTTAPPITGTPTQPPTTLPSICLEPFSCAGKPDGNHVNPWNCETWYFCVDGEIYTGFFPTCDKGTEYDPVLKACTTRRSWTSCNPLCPNEPPTPTPATTPLPPTTTQGPSSAPSTEPGVVVTTGSPPTGLPSICPPCPKVPFSCLGKTDGGYANRWDCSGFYVCVSGFKFSGTCNPGDQWNDGDRHCDTPANANCTPCPPLANHAHKRFGDFGQVEIRALCENGLSCVGKPSGKYADPLDCTAAVVCNDGVVTGRMHCPRGIQFNNQTKRCEISKTGRCLDFCGKFKKQIGQARQKIESLKRTRIILEEVPWNY